MFELSTKMGGGTLPALTWELVDQESLSRKPELPFTVLSFRSPLGQKNKRLSVSLRQPVK